MSITLPALLAALVLPLQAQALPEAMAAPGARARDAAQAGLAVRAAGDPALVERLVRALGDPDPYQAGAAAAVLGRVGAPAVPALTRALADPSPQVRWSAAIALGRAGAAAKPAAAALGQALADTYPELRQCAAVALGNLGPAALDQVPAVKWLLSDPAPAVREAAAQALRQIDPAGATRPRTEAALKLEIERRVPALMAQLKVPGVAVALIMDRKLVWSKGYGVLEAGGHDPVTSVTVFEAASMSKPVLGMLALIQADRGALDLDRPLQAYGAEAFTPDLPERGRITARMCLAHTTGFPNWRPGGEEREGPMPQLFQPGARWSYSGEGIYYLQRTLERISGQPLEVLAGQTLFQPLGLKATAFRWMPALGLLQATGHGEDGKPQAKSRYPRANGAFTLYTSVDDYARLLVEVMQAGQGRSALLSRAAVEAALTPQVRLDGRDPIERPGAAKGLGIAWGLGWGLTATAQGDIAHHGGANSTGFRCFSQFAPARGTGLVILTNAIAGGDLWTRLVAAIGDL